VISWDRSANAVRYRVERAEYVRAPLTLRPPGASRDMPVQAELRRPFTTVGTTSRPYFVDRTRQPGTSYMYQVVAEAPGGGASTPSNSQVVPDPRPPATFAQLEEAARDPGAVAAIARAHRLGDRRLLARLSRSARDDRVRELARRLERRLRYQDLAGGPAQGG
jgi:hypothetical protein